MKRLLAVVLAVCLLIGAVGPVYGAFTDISGHWAEKEIKRVVKAGIFNGISDTLFLPNGTMTRGMFVTALGRMAEIDPEVWTLSYLGRFFKDVADRFYYAPYVGWAYLQGITDGADYRRFYPDRDLTREQMAQFLCNYLKAMGLSLKSEGKYTVSFSDWDYVAYWARDSVRCLAEAGILKGMSDGRGGVRMAPTRRASRAECAVMICRILDQITGPASALTAPTSISLNHTALTLQTGQSVKLKATLKPSGVSNRTVRWYSGNYGAVKVLSDGTVEAVGEGTATIRAVSSNRLVATCKITVPSATPAPGLANADMSWSEKLMMVYGTTNVSDHRTYYTSESAASSHQTTITVKTWDINSSGKKPTLTWSLTVHEKIAPTVKAIFQEIYELPEKPPIHSLGGWRWRSWEKSEHNMGLAVDINYLENPYVPVGSDPYSAGFKPGEDPYSIPIDGSIDRIFNKYGFTRGIYWNNGNKDYMHYSFFGT